MNEKEIIREIERLQMEVNIVQAMPELHGQLRLGTELGLLKAELKGIQQGKQIMADKIIIKLGIIADKVDNLQLNCGNLDTCNKEHVILLLRVLKQEISKLQGSSENKSGAKQ